VATELEPEVVEAELDQLQKKLERLRILYEQFFLGIERVPPRQLQKDVTRIIHRLSHTRIRVSGLKFRLNSLIQRFNAHKAYWARTVREIEEGRYRRHNFRIKQAEAAEAQSEEDPLTTEDYIAANTIRASEGDEAADAVLEQRREKRRAERTSEGDAAEAFLAQLARDRGEEPPPPRAQAAPAEPAAAASEGGRRPVPEIRGMSEDQIKARADRLREITEKLQRAGVGRERPGRPAARPTAPARGPKTPDDRAVYEKLVATRRQTGESVDRLKYESVAKSLAKQREALKQKKGWSNVEFDVVVRDGKAFIKPQKIE